jgi:hypothetical protein
MTMTLSMTMTARTRRTIVRNSDEVPPTILVTARTTGGLTLAVRHLVDVHSDAGGEDSCSSVGYLSSVSSLSELSWWWWTLIGLLMLLLLLLLLPLLLLMIVLVLYLCSCSVLF